jgi:acetyl-CoA carboxylase carboxyl transferase subunit beta
VGEKVARAAEAALDERIPLVIVSASGGARMQEGTFALMQLAKTMATLERLRLNDVPYISIMSDPTTAARSRAMRRWATSTSPSRTR